MTKKRHKKKRKRKERRRAALAKEAGTTKRAVNKLTMFGPGGSEDEIDIEFEAGEEVEGTECPE